MRHAKITDWRFKAAMRSLFTRSLVRNAALLGGAGLAATLCVQQVACSSTAGHPGPGAGSTAPEDLGSIGMNLTLAGGQNVSSVSWVVTGPNGASTVVQQGAVPVQNSRTISFRVSGLPAGNGYQITLTGTSSDGSVTCTGSAQFSVTARATTTVVDTLQCNAALSEAGSVQVGAPLYNCAAAGSVSVSPSEAATGTPISLIATATGVDPSAITYAWSAPSGSFSAPSAASTNFTCSTPGTVTLTLTVGDGTVPTGAVCPNATTTVQVTCDAFAPNSLVISSSTYVNTQGAVASLAAGTTVLANKADAGALATAGNDYVNVWNNSKVDGSFGVASPIQLTNLNTTTGQVISTISVPSNQVVTSFPSKSELGLHYTTDSSGVPHIVFVAYAGAGVGALDVSNSDAVPGQDPTNPVTFAFGSSYAFARTIVSMDYLGNFTYTPTVNYGGNNGRSALLGSNGLYYSVGNANNGNATTFGASNGTNPDVTETTGLEVVNPINASSADAGIPANNSAEVNPLIQYTFNDGGKFDKPGKDNNYRGIAEFGGALYFTKGSGGNGMQTVYTVGSLPTVANAASQTISVAPGFPTDPATTGGNFTPFAVFFANATTMYVTDEGTGNATDVSTNAGLEKWSLVGNTWVLDYVLTSGLIGTVDSNLGPDGGAGCASGAPDGGVGGPWSCVTTIGLRNLTGVVNQAAGTVTLWAATSTSSASGDNGADPNKVVTITDQLSATTLPAGESFSTVVGPTYGTVYRGVVHVP
jgi:hypothetical protein